MENWNPVGWLLLVGGFLFGVVVGLLPFGDRFWLVSYGVTLAGLTILPTNLIRILWQAMRRRKLIDSRSFWLAGRNAHLVQAALLF